MIHNDLYNWLSNEPTVTALFPGGIYHASLPQDVSVWPAVSFFQVSQVEVAEDMNAPGDAKLDQATYQFDVVADGSAAAIAAADAFLTIFRNFRGTMATTRIQMIDVSGVTHLEDRRGDKLRRRVSMDFSITFDME